jgi:hypothetical protein
MTRSANQACVSAGVGRTATGAGTGTAWDVLAQAGVPGRMPTRQTSQLIATPSPPAHGVAAAGTSKAKHDGKGAEQHQEAEAEPFHLSTSAWAQTLKPHNCLIGRGFFAVCRSFT